MNAGRIYRHDHQVDVDMAVIHVVANYGLVGLALFVRWIKRDDPSIIFAVDNVTVNPHDFGAWKDVTELYETTRSKHEVLPAEEVLVPSSDQG